MQQIAAMEDWLQAQRIKFMRRLLAPCHWTCISDRERVEHNSDYLCYRQALGPDCPRRFPVLAKDLSANDTAKMPFGESLQRYISVTCLGRSHLMATAPALCASPFKTSHHHNNIYSLVISAYIIQFYFSLVFLITALTFLF